LERLLRDQLERWQRGERVLVEPYLQQWPALCERPEMVLDLIYREVCLREQHGEQPTLEEYRCRFPEHAAALERQFALHQILQATSWPPREAVTVSPAPLVTASSEEETVQDLAGDTPLSLSGQESVWVVMAGWVDVFAAPALPDGSPGPRRHLF